MRRTLAIRALVALDRYEIRPGINDSIHLLLSGSHEKAHGESITAEIAY